MSDPIYNAPIPPCEKCGRDTPESRTHTPLEPFAHEGHWQRCSTKCECGHEFLSWIMAMTVPLPAMRHGVIENVELP